jgi:quinohemoprotein amine dehydrogenase
LKITKIAAAMSGVAAVGLARASSPAVAAASAEALLRA